jgi:predicted nucleotide-binding protein (sugar kinase/HSP70/actin superfamily)
LAHYASLARKALDDAGYQQVPIITTDQDTKNMHPGFTLSPRFQLRMIWALAFVDTLESLRRRLRPYELIPGSLDTTFDAVIKKLALGLARSIRAARRAFIEGVDALSALPLTDEPQRPQVFIIGEFLLNFHPTSNFDIEHYLEANGMEVVLPDILDSFRRDFMRMKTERREFHIRHPFLETAMTGISDVLFDYVIHTAVKVAERNPRYKRRDSLPNVARYSEKIVHHTFTSGEGWMIAGEILHHAAHGLRSFLILQPFGCMPNHVTGRGLVKRLKELHPSAQILSLDYDPDTSFANIENRLQMLILNSKLAAPAG